MDDRTLQFALFLSIAAALYLLVVVGIEMGARLVRQWRERPARAAVAVGHDLPRHHD
jgi:hypothetical protein